MHGPQTASSKALQPTRFIERITFSTISVDNYVHIL